MRKSIALLLIAIGASLGMSGCATVAGNYVTMDKSGQAAMTPDAALAALKQGNDRFVSGAMVKRDLMKQVKATGYGQYPLASVVSCIDSRA